jgi:hypothetical protein
MSRRRRVIQGLDTLSRGRLRVQGRDTSRRSTFADSARCSYSVGEVSFPHRISHTLIQTLTHLRPGPSDVTGLMGSLLDLMSKNFGC